MRFTPVASPSCLPSRPLPASGALQVCLAGALGAVPRGPALRCAAGGAERTAGEGAADERLRGDETRGDEARDGDGEQDGEGGGREGGRKGGRHKGSLPMMLEALPTLVLLCLSK